MAICEQRLTIRLTISKAAAKQAATTIRGLCTYDPLPTVDPWALHPLVSASSMADLLASPFAEHSSTVAPAVQPKSCEIKFVIDRWLALISSGEFRSHGRKIKSEIDDQDQPKRTAVVLRKEHCARESAWAAGLLWVSHSNRPRAPISAAAPPRPA